MAAIAAVVGLTLWGCPDVGIDDPGLTPLGESPTPEETPTPGDTDSPEPSPGTTPTPPVTPTPEEPTPVVTDDDGDGYSEDDGDCDDTDLGINPGATETCNGLDDNCNGQVDDVLSVWYQDGDGDGWGADPGAPFVGCRQPAGYSAVGGDCDDLDASAYPGATEVCDSVDNDCDGVSDEGIGAEAPPDAPVWHKDDDGDGYGATGSTVISCNPIGEGWSLTEDDCNDANAAINPGAAEVCGDGVDNDCDGAVDEGFDADGDGYSSCRGDCNDANAAIHPGATETCNGADDNCNGQADEGLTADTDHDGHTAVGSCSGLADDCDDRSVGVYPGADEVCDGKDNDCNGQIDEVGGCRRR